MTNTSVHWAREPWQGVALAVRESCVHLVLREIDFVFAPELGALAAKHAERETSLQAEMGQRRARATVWLERINWTDAPPAKLGEILHRLQTALADEHPEGWQRVEFELDRVGWRVNGHGPLVKIAAGLRALPELTNAEGIRRELTRLEASIASEDPHGAIGYAKNLVEATAKYAHARATGSLSRDPHFRPLVGSVGQRLVQDMPEGAPAALAEFLQSLTATVEQIGPLRNRVDGSVGHGSPIWDEWLIESHSKLIAEVAISWVRYVLEWLEAATDTSGSTRD